MMLTGMCFNEKFMNAFSKKAANLVAAVSLHYMYFILCARA